MLNSGKMHHFVETLKDSRLSALDAGHVTTLKGPIYLGESRDRDVRDVYPVTVSRTALLSNALATVTLTSWW